MQNVKKWIATVLTLAMVLATALTTTAFGAVNDTGYTDVDAGHPYAEAIQYCREHGLMNGVGNGRFDPDGTLDREMLATVLWRLENEPVVNYLMQFSDVSDSWYTEAVRWAASEQIMGGYGGGKWGVGDPVTRQDMTTTLWRYAGELPAEHTSRYEDESAIANYAAPAVDWSDANGIVAPVSDTAFAPRENATRAQVAAALMNFHKSVQTAPDTTPSGGARVLVAYFSGTGTTRGVAENLVTALGADTATLHEITPAQPYTAADLDYTNSNCRSVTEQHDPSTRPAIANSVSNLEQYDVVFLGYPIWNNDAPRIIYTFLESNDLSGKTIVPFCTSGGSGITNSVSNIRGLVSGAAWADGRRCYSSDTVSTLSDWVNGLGLDLNSTPAPAPTPKPSNEPKVLVAYFSATNTTKPLAEYIADGLNADLYEIVPQTPYTSTDLNWHDSSTRATVEMNDPSARPAIDRSVSNMEQYDVVFVGYPIWWDQAPRIISTFLESYDFSGKTIVP
ncbi:MAG: S-layer homology domain-containing protein, partial [Ruminococcus flavefaciens]|nr:S-layer homology domain-containing protein [Ruminococcus flavefaciens]